MRNSERGTDQTGLYRAVWRWHFYAGLIVLPFLAWLAATGALYLYKPEIERAYYGGWTEAHAPGPRLPLDALARAVEHQAQGKVTQLIAPAAVGNSWQASVTRPEGERLTAFVDPGDGLMLGLVRQGGVMKLVRDLHSLIITGPIGNALIEIAAGWAILLVLSGFYLWWPRGSNPAIGVRGRPGRRLFWRDLHASTGAIAGLLLLFLALTGMPWSGSWGRIVQNAVAAQGWGRPKPPTGDGHGAHDAAARETLPWSRQAMPMPGPMGHGGQGDDIGPQRIAAIVADRGLQPPWTMSMPMAPGAPYLVSKSIGRADDARALYIDAATGTVLQDAGYADFGPAARVIEWGIATHQGQQYGEANRLVMLAGCIAMLLLAVSAPVLWWKRRVRGRLDAPPRGGNAATRGVAAIMLAVGALFPLTGATMVAALVVEGLAGAARRFKPRRRA